MKLSLDKDASLFGLNDSTQEYLLKLSAANAFAQLRKELDRNITVLKTLSTKNFSKRRNGSFIYNLEKLVKGDKEGKAFLPFLINSENSIDQLIVALASVSKVSLERMENNGLIDNFAALFSRVVGDCTIFPEMRTRFIEIIINTCEMNSTENGQILLDLLALSPKTKRRRLNPPPSVPLILSPAALAPPDIENRDVPPDHIPKTVLFQLLEANGERLGAVLADSPMLKAIKVGRQWNWERQRDFSASGEMRTDCIIAMIHKDPTQDISFVLRVGYKPGWEIASYLGFRESEDQNSLPII